MKKDNMIILSPYEQAAYWWINKIRDKVREIKDEGYSFGSKRTVTNNFYNIFSHFSEEEWRHLYLELIPLIELDVINLSNSEEYFIQEEKINGHNILNKELSKILKVNVPDICLTLNDTKESVLFVNKLRCSYWYKSLPNKRIINNKYYTKYNYVLTGNKEELAFYSIIKATLYNLMVNHHKDYTLGMICNIFCKAYLKYLNIVLDSDNDYEEYLKNEFMEVLWRKYSITDSDWTKELYMILSLKDIDINGISEYQDIANLIAKQICYECDGVQKKKQFEI